MMTSTQLDHAQPAQQTPVIVIGLDAAEPSLLHRWINEGRLPFMKSLIEAGVFTPIVSHGGLFSDSVWPSFSTGVDPSRHGYYNYLQLKRGTTEMIRLDATSCPYYPFWWLLRSTGKKVAIFDVPKTYPIPGVDGVQICSWGEEYPQLSASSLPPALAKEIIRRFGHYHHVHDATSHRPVNQEIKAYDTLRWDLDHKIKATQFVMEQSPWDLFMTVFSEAHYAGHQLYHHHDRHHWAHDPACAGALGEALPTTYAVLDQALAGLLRDQLDRATVLVLSVHGLETNYSGNHLLQTTLEKLGYQVPANSPGESSGQPPRRSLSARVKDLIPGRVRQLINEKLVSQASHDRAYSQQFSSRIDWQRTQAFFMPGNDHFQGYISLNLKGREPWGQVEPGADADQLSQQIAADLKQLVNPQTGQPAVQDVVITSQILQGHNLLRLPDLVVQWASGAVIHELHHPRLGLIPHQPYAFRRSRHTSTGFMIAAGQHIRPSALAEARPSITNLDLAPTLLYLLGQSIPNDMDGQVLLELITDEFRASHPVQYGNRSLIIPHEMVL